MAFARRAAWRRWPGRLLVPAQPRPHRQPVALVRWPRADLAAGARTGPRRREAHGVLGYLTDGAIWSDWFLPGLHQGSASSGPCSVATRRPSAGFAALPRPGGSEPAACAWSPGSRAWPPALAWLIAPTSASGPEGMARGFESGLRYLAPALVLGLALLPSGPARFERQARAPRRTGGNSSTGAAARRMSGGGIPGGCLVAALRRDRDRLSGPAPLSAEPLRRPGLRRPPASTPPSNGRGSVSGARIATTSTRQYPLFGTDLSNRVAYVGDERPAGGFVSPRAVPPGAASSTKATWLRRSHHATAIEPGQAPIPAHSCAGPKPPARRAVLREAPDGRLQAARTVRIPAACR